MPPQAKILIVDDHEDTVYALESALAPLGYRLTHATNGDAALKEVLRGPVGLLLLDVRMPGVSGLDVVRYMRGVEQTQHIPVILLTGFGPDAELTSTAFRLGVADLVMKPIDPLALRIKVRYLYDAHERAHALEREIHTLRARLKNHEEHNETDAATASEAHEDHAPQQQQHHAPHQQQHHADHQQQEPITHPEEHCVPAQRDGVNDRA
ncbi:response regulator [Streptomyces ipomoeae]|uniref:Response regulator n=1 Tax=Streptomyces ipomoeae TaxID=103232 RepID=A0AAE9AZ08_9ACTN|nr:response regulator [Streptomyces ipomoeae]TQE27633.1 response regulator [Streptomyces ipomoeae]